jgi:hypothetical protein
MSYPPADEPNPVAAPRAEIGENVVDLGGDTDAELTRRTYLSHEASVKSVGYLNYLGAVILAIAAVFCTLAAASFVPVNAFPGNDMETTRVIMAVAAGGCLLFFFINFAIGYGLTHLKTWARWTMVVLLAINLLSSAFQLVTGTANNPPAVAGQQPPPPGSNAASLIVGAIIALYILYLMVSPKSNVVFSREYKAVIAKTPHIKYKSGCVAKVGVAFLILVGALILIGVVSTLLKR